MLCNNSKLAKTSSTPGKTQTINHFLINNSWYLVDLPGYGYSKMSKSEQSQVGAFTDYYLKNRKEISLVVFLVDIRHKPTSNDKLMYDYIIRSGLPYIILANKADKIAITKVDSAVTDLQIAINPMKDAVYLPFSAERIVDSNLPNVGEPFLRSTQTSNTSPSMQRTSFD